MRLVNAYASASSLAIPTRAHKARIHINPKWFNPTIKALTRRKSKLHYLCRAAPLNPDLKAEYNQICKQVKLAVRRAVCRFEALIVRSCKHQPKLLYNYINSQKACRDSIKSLMDSDGNYQTDGRIIANLLNDHFSSAFSIRSAEPIPTVPLRSSVKYIFAVDVFSPVSIKKYIDRLNPRPLVWTVSTRSS